MKKIQVRLGQTPQMLRIVCHNGTVEQPREILPMGPNYPKLKYQAVFSKATRTQSN